MKKLLNLALVGTMVLAAVACVREQAGDSPLPSNEDGVKEVTTQFVLNVASAPTTKMSADVVQQNHNFRGIQDVKLFVYKTGTSNASEVEEPTDENTNKPYVVKTTAPLPDNVKEFDLGYFMSPTSISNEGTNNNDNSSNRILQLSIPVGVDAVMLYGKAIKGTGASDEDYGVTLDYNPHDTQKKKSISSTPSKTQFYGKSILNDQQDDYDATGRLMIYIINDILATYVPENGTVTVGTGESAKTFSNLPELSWAQLGHTYEINTMGDDSRYDADDANVEKMPIPTGKTSYVLEGLEEVLGKCYYLFTYIKPKEDLPDGMVVGSDAWHTWIKTHRQLGEYRGGSSFSLKKTIIDFYKIISAAAEADPTNEKEANAQRLAGQILYTAKLYINENTGSFNPEGTIESYLKNQGHWSPTFNGAKDLNGYPFDDFGIPEGAAQLTFDVQCSTQQDDAFRYMDPNFPLVNPQMTSFHPRKYLYPAELWYYVNSPIRTNDSDVTTADFPNGVSQWNATASWGAVPAKQIKAWLPNGAVASATKAVAVTNNVNYGVALLQSEVSIGSGVSELLDNRDAMTDEDSDRHIKLTDAHIALKGILVGGVNPRMNWQFTRYYTQSGQPGTSAGLGFDEGDLSLFDGVIYDHSTGDTPPEISKTAVTNYTLVFDNYNSNAPGTGQTVADMQNDVYVSLEFINNGDAFWGRDNLIPNGGVFYLVGKLPKPNTDQINGLATKWPSDHQIPPLYGIDGEDVPDNHFAGESKKVARVFIQDFVTTAKFTLGENSLKHAYYSVPDLRASQMSLGLSVDLQWISGLSYAIDL